jgi:hypothetical protein
MCQIGTVPLVQSKDLKSQAFDNFKCYLYYQTSVLHSEDILRQHILASFIDPASLHPRPLDVLRSVTSDVLNYNEATASSFMTIDGSV